MRLPVAWLPAKSGLRGWLRRRVLHRAPVLFVRLANPTREELGLCGEELAARHVRALGWRLLGQRVRTEHAELDLLARDGATLVAIEVKAGRVRANKARLPRRHLTPRTLRRQERALASLASLAPVAIGETGDPGEERWIRQARKKQARSGSRVPGRLDLIEIRFEETGEPELRHWTGLGLRERARGGM